MKIKWSGPVLCASLLLALIMSTCPWGPVPFADDWDYEATALAIVQTGHLEYHNWGVPTLGVQAFWAAPFVRLFGPSVEVIRFSTIPIALGCSILIYLLGRQLRCAESLCWFGTLAIMTSPIVLSLEASFMTELPSLFFELLCFMAAILALRARTNRSSAAWLIWFTIFCLLGGTIRQSNWLVGASLPIMAVYWWRGRAPRWLPASAIGSCIVLFAIAVWLQRWFLQQPGSFHRPILAATGHSVVHDIVRLSFLFLSTVAIFVLPGTLIFLRYARRSAAYVVPVLAFWGLVYFWLGKAERAWHPFPTGALASASGIATTTILGNQPWHPGYYLWLGLAAVAISLAANGLALLCWRSPELKRDEQREASQIRVQWFVAVLPFAVVYTVAMEIFSREFWPQDRYPVPLLPVIVLSILMLYQQAFGRSSGAIAIPQYCWGCLAAFAYFAIAGTHDHYASLRAVHDQAQSLMSTGVRRTSIIGGFEFDAPTQLIAAGRLKLDPKRLHRFTYWFSPYLSVDDGRWLITEAHYPGMLPTQWPALQFTLWLPPFRQQMLVEQVPDAVTGPK